MIALSLRSLFALFATLGVLEWGDAGPDQRVPITDTDALWAARMVVGSQEGAARTGGPAAAARLWCAANRHALQCDRDRRAGRRRCRWSTFAASFRAYSTAVSPRWSSTGWCALGGRAHGLPMCGAARLRRRAFVSGLSWPTIERRYPPLRTLVHDWIGGLVPPPPGLERAAHTDCTGCSAVPRGAVVLGSNWWAPDRESARWPDGYVRLVTAR